MQSLGQPYPRATERRCAVVLRPLAARMLASLSGAQHRAQAQWTATVEVCIAAVPPHTTAIRLIRNMRPRTYLFRVSARSRAASQSRIRGEFPPSADASGFGHEIVKEALVYVQGAARSAHCTLIPLR